MKNKVECPCCLGTGQHMEARETKGFKYEDCTLCDKTGVVEQQIADDYVFANSGEENFESNEDW